jgi:DNA-binding NarL/FixJ family response regulator
LDLSHVNGINFLARVERRHQVRTARFRRAALLRGWEEAGACGFLCQDISAEGLLKSLELIVLGEVVVHPQFSWGEVAVGQIQANGESQDKGAFRAEDGVSLQRRHSDPQSSPPILGIATEPSSQTPAGDVARGLSRREMLILQMLIEGASNKAIALRLVTSR